MVLILVFVGYALPITARQLREFALPGACLPAGRHSIRLIVPVVSRELSRWAAGYGAIFAITVCEGFCAITVKVVC